MDTERGMEIQANGRSRLNRTTIDATGESTSLKSLFRQLADDATLLVREEVRLAKLEIREDAKALGSDLVKVGIAVGLAWFGAMAMVAFLILIIGQLIGAYWAGALIVGVAFLLIGGILARNAVNDLRNRNFAPEETIETLKADKRWAEAEAREFKEEMRS